MLPLPTMHSVPAKCRGPASAQFAAKPCSVLQNRTVKARFMRSETPSDGSKAPQQNTGSPHLDLLLPSLEEGAEALQGTMMTMSQHARDSLGWLRHALQDPDDFSASAIGRMVSKEYGRHERPHTDHHMLRSSSPRTSPGSSPTAQQHGTATTAPTVEQGVLGAQRVAAAQHGTAWGWGWGLGIPASSSATEGEGEVWHSPPSGPGFLLQQQKRQEEQDGPGNTR